MYSRVCASFLPVAVAAALLPLAVVAALLSLSVRADRPPDPRIAPGDGYVAEQACRDCHRDQAQAFDDSHHARAMAVANIDSVRARFNNRTFSAAGRSARFLRRGDGYAVRTEGPDGETGEFAVRYTFGWEPLQQYLLELPGGRLQALDIAWDTERGRWFWLGEGEAPEPGSGYHWTGPFYRWNRTCADCHSTAVETGFKPDRDQYTTTYADTSIGCQSCHGPGAEHVERASRGTLHGETLEGGAELTPAPQMTACFSCHSRRTEIAEGYRPGAAFLDHYAPELLRPGLYYPDGQILDEVFEYGSFLQSKMARAGVSCGDCHDPHSGRLLRPGDATCTHCHGRSPAEEFASAAGGFESSAHHHHAPDSAGARCVNCHMPARVYMQVDPRRDHAFVIPRPDLSRRLGVPNACTGCHQDRDPAWAETVMDRWYGRDWRRRDSIADTFAAAWNGDADALSALRRIAADGAAAPIVRASALSALGPLAGPSAYDPVRQGAAESDPLLRLGAAEAAAALPPAARLTAIGGLLEDSRRAVRLAALRALAAVPQAHWSSAQRTALQQALTDLDAYAAANPDVAEAQTSIGSVLFDLDRVAEARTRFRRAIELDPSFAGAHINLAESFRHSGEQRRAAETYARATAQNPANAELSYGYGLALVRLDDLEGALEQLRQAVRQAPDDPRYATALALILERQGRVGDAFSQLRGMERTDTDLLATRLRLALRLGHYDAALQDAQALAARRPADQQLAQLIARLRAQAGAGGDAQSQ